jgi:outer membrane lipoprotein-sorting protein
MFGYLEEVIDKEAKENLEAHLSSCESCREALEDYKKIMNSLVEHAEDTKELSVVEPVMTKINQLNGSTKAEAVKEKSFFDKIFNFKWGFGFSTAALALLILFNVFNSGPNSSLAAAQTLLRAAQATANLKSIDLKARLRTLPGDNFSNISEDDDFVDIELKAEFGKNMKWRFDKPGRICAMDGKTTVLFLKPDYARRIESPTYGAFDTGWLLNIAMMSRSLHAELKAIKKNNWNARLEQIIDSAGKKLSIVVVEAKSSYSSDAYLRNKFFCTSNTKRVYVFDDETGRMMSAKIYLESGKDYKLIFDLSEINYDTEFASDTFQIKLPKDVCMYEPMKMLPDNKKYEAMTPEEAAKAIFVGFETNNWEELKKFQAVYSNQMKKRYGSLKLIKLGKHFKTTFSLINGAHFVPYEIKLKDGKVQKHNIALKRDKKTNRWYFDGGL